MIEKNKTIQNQTWSKGLLEEINHCPACGEEKTPIATFKRRDDYGVMCDLWSMRQCSNCLSIWLAQRPDELSLPRAYENYYTHKSAEDFSKKDGIVNSLINGYLNKRFGFRKRNYNSIGFYLFSFLFPLGLKLDYYGRHLKLKSFEKKGRLLDIGCGNGEYLLRAIEMGWNGEGCEVDPKAFKTCIEAGLKVHQGDAFNDNLMPSSFDVVVLSHVIEHVSDQVHLLKRAYELLKPGGLIWLAWPNPESVGVSVFKDAWSGLHPPFHLCIPSKLIMKKMLGDAGFTDVKDMRRGIHAKSTWSLSRRISNIEKINLKSIFYVYAAKIYADFLASFTGRAEEVIFFAKKPY